MEQIAHSYRRSIGIESSKIKQIDIENEACILENARPNFLYRFIQ